LRPRLPHHRVERTCQQRRSKYGSGCVSRAESQVQVDATASGHLQRFRRPKARSSGMCGRRIRGVCASQKGACAVGRVAALAGRLCRAWKLADDVLAVPGLIWGPGPPASLRGPCGDRSCRVSGPETPTAGPPSVRTAGSVGPPPGTPASPGGGGGGDWPGPAARRDPNLKMRVFYEARLYSSSSMRHYQRLDSGAGRRATSETPLTATRAFNEVPVTVQLDTPSVRTSQ
jgi:hypothetical protein